MIDRAEIRRRAGRLGLLPSQVEKDHILSHVLVAIAQARTSLVFRGGTALARVYWPDFRLSEDLDFMASTCGQDEGPIRGAVAAAARAAGVDLDVRFSNVRGRTRAVIRWDGGSIQVDVNVGQTPALPTQRLPLDLPYSDLASPTEIEVVALEEILADKWWMLDERTEPRDLFDLWTGLCVRGVAPSAVAAAFRTAHGYEPPLEFIERAARCADAWEVRLSHQVRELPPFDRVLADLRALAEAWAVGG